ncbi:P-loop containing nucleoside triphosphate hydrolase protein, partial [Mycena leptocephala]
PPRPKIFHGRESELEHIMKILTQDTARISIIGGGGMGKTSLARAALHHPEIATKYEKRLFVTCDSAQNSIELAAQIGLHIGLQPGKDLRQAVAKSLSSAESVLLILDNLETPWEPLKSRSEVEEFLSLLSDLRHLALLITMRGAERPAKVAWTRPFLQPLKPLSNEAARQTFIDVADNTHDEQSVKRLLHLTDNMPLAVEIIAHLVDYEGCSTVLARWESEKTSLLSKSYDRKSNLDASIRLSLSSPRILSLPGAYDLLRILSVLPDGLTDTELVQSNLPINHILRCKVALLRTSLAYIDDMHRLKSLTPIREHIRHFDPPSPLLVRPLQQYFHSLLELYQKYMG